MSTITVRVAYERRTNSVSARGI